MPVDIIRLNNCTVKTSDARQFCFDIKPTYLGSTFPSYVLAATDEAEHFDWKKLIEVASYLATEREIVAIPPLSSRKVLMDVTITDAGLNIVQSSIFGGFQWIFHARKLPKVYIDTHNDGVLCLVYSNAILFLVPENINNFIQYLIDSIGLIMQPMPAAQYLENFLYAHVFHCDKLRMSPISNLANMIGAKTETYLTKLKLSKITIRFCAS